MTNAPLNISEATDNNAQTGGLPECSAQSEQIASGDEGGRQRKRGTELEDAIRTACVAELAETGYGELTIESVAARAQTGKASIYRRWPCKQDLVVDSVAAVMSGPMMYLVERNLEDSVSTRDALLDGMVQVVAMMGGVPGAALRSVMGESLRDRSFAGTFQCEFFDPRKEALFNVLRRGVDRGEVRPDAVDDLVIDMIAGTMIHRVLIRQQRPTKADLERMLDRFIMPAIAPR